MDWQLFIVNLLIGAAVMVTLHRLYQFFRKPASHCDGCSGCQLKELKKNLP